MNKKYRIGRDENNDIKVMKPQISGLHCTITVLSENIILIEDNDSTNGTFLNGLRVKRALITPSDEVVLANLKINFDKIFSKHAHKPPIEKTPQAIAQVPINNDFSEDFTQLKIVYETFRDAKLSLMGQGTLKQKGLQAALSFIPFVGSALGILATTTVNPQEKIFALTEEFKINYVCPKCKRFLGDLPWQNLANQKKCSACKAIWVS